MGQFDPEINTFAAYAPMCGLVNRSTNGGFWNDA
jgi:hypothetical protein